MSLHVLVTDDNAMNRMVIKQLCRHFGFAFDQAASGEVALNLLGGDGYACDLLLLDLRMPGLSGEQTLSGLREMSRWGGLKVVAYSAHIQGADAEALPAKGFDGVLSKPISLDSFRRELIRLGLLGST